MELNELTFDNMGVWPMPAKVVVIAFACVIILALGYWFAIKPEVKKISEAEVKEIDLRSLFEIKSAQAANLGIYKKQVEQVKQMLSSMLQQLPEETEVPNLVEDISKVGIANGLEFNLIKPQAEKKMDFYAELPIEILVTGNYHQFGEFISQIASLQRIVTIDDFEIEPIEKTKNSGAKDTAQQTGPLQMKLLAKTYHYLDEKDSGNLGENSQPNGVESAIKK